MAASSQIGVIFYGLGPIGLGMVKLVSTRPNLRPVGAIDINPALLGRDLGEVAGTGNLGVKVTGAAEAFQTGGAQVVIHCTGSALAKVLPQLLECVEAGLNVVSTCEELSYPWMQNPDLAAQLDDACRAKGVTVLGTGVNPGFAMDYLPAVLSGVARRVDHVTVHRVQDAGTRRLPLQQKVGAGLTVAEFEQRVAAGTVRHVGLPESAQAVAAVFGWKLDELKDEIGPVLAEKPTESGLGLIQPGQVTGVRQVATGFAGGREVLKLTLEMAVGLPEPRDEIWLKGDPDLHMIIPGGLHGDIATAAVVVNSVPRVIEAAPGLLVMADMAPPHP